MIIQHNFAPSALPATVNAAELVSQITGRLTELLADSSPDPDADASLRVHLDWVQYKSTFRDPVVVRFTVGRDGEPLPQAEIAIDLRHVDPARLEDLLASATRTLRAGSRANGDRGPVVLGEFTPWRSSVIWPFNRLFWQRLDEWEAHARRGYEAALPSGGSDGHQPQAVDDSVDEFWTLLRDLDSGGQLPPEIYAMEIGVGSGARARLWLDRFKTIDAERGSGFYSRLKFLLGDYSPATLDTALVALGPHAPICSALAIDAHDPLKALSFMRFKLLFVHLTNVYDNLSFDEIVRRDGQLYIVEVRPYVSRAAADRIAAESDVTTAQLTDMIRRLLDSGPEALGTMERGMVFWNCVWNALRFEERLALLDEADTSLLPKGVSRSALDDILADAPYDVRFHLSRGAAQSFVNTVPLLHPRGYLQVQDIFVTGMQEYAQGFRGPGKLDGSFVTWVNGAFLRAIGARAGYDVHFAPFKYRKGSKTQVLYTTPRP